MVTVSKLYNEKVKNNSIPQKQLFQSPDLYAVHTWIQQNLRNGRFDFYPIQIDSF